MAIAKTIGQPHLLDPAHIDGIDKAGNPFGNEMRVIDGERQLECRRLDGIEIVAPLLDRMREVVNFRLIRLLIQVLEQNQRAVPLGMNDDPLQAIETGSHPPLLVGGEMEARMLSARPTLTS